MATVNLVDATEKAFAAASHLTDADAGSMAALLALARKIDAWDVIVGWAFEDASEDESRPKIPSNDNVSIATYLKGCEQLGLTPSGRAALSKGRPAESGPPTTSKAAKLTALQGGKSVATG
ncbi:terminase small subunit [Curtobacterium flaccumfaciens]|uniref:terminase small subunit n=1 Tax=Curtobacterium flaccumfaciens TaxID=2035 RepID=UPI001BDF721F|nr:hypothetical protein [Curtobacterium flaccumfaciens]MBT1630441.1 hypothetical protein [Curtobacterium flaccumfaciens pv. oortii]MCX2843921.1 hypothetical protein [Curtobacterium flaccumfaciens pv. oortii]